MYLLILAVSGTTKEQDAVEKDEMILDIGPKTVNNIKNIIDQSNTVFWNGPAGYFENINFLLAPWKWPRKFQKIQLGNL